MNHGYCLRLLVVLVAAQWAWPASLAKGLGELAPSPPPEAPENAEPQADNSQEEGDGKEARAEEEGRQEKAAAPEPPSKLSLQLKDRLSVASSYGMAYVAKEGTSWSGSGMSDIAVIYKLEQQLAEGELFATLRYAPMDVAPKISKKGSSESYLGVLEAYLAGASWQRRVASDTIRASADAELGLVLVHLQDQLYLMDAAAPDQMGFLLTVGGGADWNITPHFVLGPKLRIGLGSYTTVQLCASATFAF